MERDEIDEAIEKFMHPTPYTGVQPLLIVAEEIAAGRQLGDIIDAVWVRCDEGKKGTFDYITKFAVKGTITPRGSYSPDERAPFHGRLALITPENLEHTVLHRHCRAQINAFKAKRTELADRFETDFGSLDDALRGDEEIFVFRAAEGDWEDPLSDIDLDLPYRVIGKGEDAAYILEHPKTGSREPFTLDDRFHGFLPGCMAEMSGLRLKSESYRQTILTLQAKAKAAIRAIDWLKLDDPRLTAVIRDLPRHPFDAYFRYVPRHAIRRLDPSKDLLDALERMVAQHMPDLLSPTGEGLIPIDNLLYLLHQVIPREEALLALEACDVVHEPSGIVLGHSGQRRSPPKFLVPLSHVAVAYERFPAFIESCRHYPGTATHPAR